MSPATVLAGSGISQQRLHVERHILEKSPVIRDWIEDPDTISPKLVLDGALNLSFCDPEVVKTVLLWLQKSDKLPPTRRLEYALDDMPPQNPSLLFHVKMYKLALCLALDDLCFALISTIRGRSYDVRTFIGAAVEAEKGGLNEEQRFRDWMVGYVSQNSEKLMESLVMKDAIMSGGDIAWRLCSLLMSSLTHINQKAASSTVFEAGNMPTPSQSPNPTPDQRSQDKYFTSVFGDFLSPNESPVTPEQPRPGTYRRSSPYASSPSTKQKRTNNQESPTEKKRRLNAYVEDARDSE